MTDATISASLPKPGHMKRNPANREFVTVTYSRMTAVGSVQEEVSSLRRSSLPASGECLSSRFESFGSAPFPSMLWVDPANWTADTEGELAMMKQLAEHFATTLSEHEFDVTKLKAEWKVVKHTAKYFYPNLKSSSELWKSLLSYRRKQFPNACLLVEVVFAIGVSNGTVESCFSFLTAMLTDRRLSLLHDTMADLLLIRANHSIWSEQERQDFISCALQKYLSTRRKSRLEPAPLEPAAKRMIVELSDSDSSSDTSDSSSADDLESGQDEVLVLSSGSSSSELS